MEPDLPERLRRLRTLLAESIPGVGAGAGGGLAEGAERAADRLDRDLLPRTAGSHAHLVVGIVGPNNAGKSALFNSLVGTCLSPSLATGGATRRLIGAANRELCQRLAEEPTLAQFPLRRAAAGSDGVREALDLAGDPAQLLLCERAELPPGLLLIDTPDFDSILAENRKASESLLKVADLAVVVVTRHTYQNRDVVVFLETWLAHGRPWMLVYNESLGSDVTREHAQKLASDLSSEPVAVFHAAFEIEIAQGSQQLSPVGVYGEDVEPGVPLDRWLFDLHRTSELKRRALAASLSQLRDDVRVLARELHERGRAAAAILERVERRAARLGRDVAGQAMPMRPFLEAFRAVLDRRPNLIQRRIRSGLRRGRLLFESALARLPFTRKTRAPADGTVNLVELERRALAPRWSVFFEELGVFVDAESAEVDESLERLLATDLDASHLEPARERALATLSEDPEILRQFQDACEELIEEELGRRGSEWFFQLAVDALHFLPAVAAGIVIFKTGGLGTDIAVGGAGAVSSMLAERLSKLLGTDVARGARERWMNIRGERLATVLLEAAFQHSLPVLRARAKEQSDLASELTKLSKEISWTAMPRTKV